jgi:hypothetical protein
MMERIYRGHVRKDTTKWKWEIQLFADEFLNAIYPFLVGKKQQADLIKNMKRGEGMIVHAKLRDMKGNYGGSTSRIDAVKNGEDPRNYKTDVKELPKGVYQYSSGNYMTKVRKDKIEYCLGTFKTIEEAEKQYKKYKKLIDDEKRGGSKVDLAKFRLENKEKQPEPPQAYYDERPKGIYLTPFNTFQVKHKNRTICTCKDFNEAKEKLRDYLANL